MNGFCGILSKDSYSIDKSAFIKSINLIDTMHTETVSKENYFSVVSFLDSAPVKGPRLFETADFIFHFAGDLINVKEIPWSDIVDNFSRSNFKWFASLRGVFAFAVLNKKQSNIYLLSDNRAQLPIYYGYIDDCFVFSTSIASFTTLNTVPEFNVEWLYEYLYFNFPIDTTTCLKNVSRISSRSLVSIDLELKSETEQKFGEKLKTAKKILKGREAYNIFSKRFRETVLKYYKEAKLNIVALSGGFDSRTLLSIAPKKANVVTYTYGIEDTADLQVASKITNKLKLNHKKILFDEDFKSSLSELIYETVRLSGGVQSILRSTLPYVYSELSKINSKDTSVVIGGIGGDVLRGASGEADSAISIGMDQYYRTGDTSIDKEFYKKMFNGSYADFEKHVQNTFKKIKKLYGDPRDPASYMSFDIYEVDPKYFGGECAIASNYITLRTPYLDRDILEMAYKTEIGNLGLSPYHKSENEIAFKRLIFQTKVINLNPDFKYTFINGMPITLFARGNEFLFKICRLCIRGFAHLKGEVSADERLEDWDNWFKNILHKEFDNLLHNKSLLIDYIDKDFLKSVGHSNDIHLIGKLVSTEILLNLIKNKWNIENDNIKDSDSIKRKKVNFNQ